MSLEIQLQKLTDYLNENKIEININSLNVLLKSQRITVKMTTDQIITTYLIFECNNKENITNRRDQIYKKLIKKEHIFDGYFLINESKEFFTLNDQKSNKHIDVKKLMQEVSYNSNTINKNEEIRLPPSFLNSDLIDYTNIYKNQIYLKLKNPLSKTSQLKELLYEVRKFYPGVYFEGFLISDDMLENTGMSYLNNDFLQILNNQTGNFKYEAIRLSNNRFALISNDVDFIIKKFNFNYRVIENSFPLANAINTMNVKTKFYKSLEKTKIYLIKTMEIKPIEILIQSNDYRPLPIIFYLKNLSKISNNLSRKYINLFIKKHGLSEYVNQLFIDLYVLTNPEFPNTSLLNFLNFTLKSFENNIFNIENGKFFSVNECCLEENISNNQIRETFGISYFIIKDEENFEIIYPFNLSILPIIKSHIKNLTKLSRNCLKNTLQILEPHNNSFDVVLSESYIEKSFKIKTNTKRPICNVAFISKFKNFALILITKEKTYIKFHERKDTSNEIKKSIVLETAMQFGYEYILCNQEIGCLFK